MSGQWYCKIFAQEFGPVTFDELKNLAEFGTLSTIDEVRHQGSDDWVLAETVEELSFAPRPATEESAATVETTIESAFTSADGWYCKLRGQELGPLNFEELRAYVERRELDANDEVRYGSSGNWLRVGTIDGFAAALTSHELHAPEDKKWDRDSSTTLSSNTPICDSTPASAPGDPVQPSAAALPGLTQSPELSAAAKAAIQDAEVYMVRAQSAYQNTELIARDMLAWALSPDRDPAWWGLVAGVVYGPFDFLRIFDWVKTGQMQIFDFVGNAAFGQFVPVGNVPGLIHAAYLMRQATEAIHLAQFHLAEINASAIAEATSAVPTSTTALPAVTTNETQFAAATQPPALPQVVTATPTDLNGIQNTPIATQPTGSRSVATTVIPPVVSSGSVFSSMPNSAAGRTPLAQSSSSAPRPLTRPRSSEQSRFSSFIESLSVPSVAGIILVVVLLLLAAGWIYNSSTSVADLKRYDQLQKLLVDVRAKRAAKDTDFAEIKARATSLTKEMSPPLTKEANKKTPGKQALLWAVRDELPRFMAGDLGVESKSESHFAYRLNEAKKHFHIK